MLKEIISESHWTQEQLAAKLGVSFATVNSWINGRTKPQKSLIPDIQRLYLAQDVTREPEPIYITLVNVEPEVRIGDYVILEKDKDNNYDDEAIMAKRVDVNDIIKKPRPKTIIIDESGVVQNSDEPTEPDAPTDLEELTFDSADWGDKVEAIEVYMGISQAEGLPRPMHVANSVSTVVRGTRSSGRIYDKFDLNARAQVIFVAKNHAIARIVSWKAGK